MRYSKNVNMDNIKILKQFNGKGDIISIEPFGNGHINKTYLVTTTMRQYIFQCINSNAFKDVELLMNNISHVTAHLLKKNVFTIKFLKTEDGKLYFLDGDSYYRVYRYIDHSICHEEIDSLELIKKAAEAFGDLHCELADLDATLLKEVIPHFHDTPKRYRDLLDAIKQNKMGRLDECQKEIKDVELLKPYFGLIVDAIDKKEIPLCITHNDPKINNVLFDEETDEVKCVIDLDTVMPGSVLYDFGDALRSLFTGNNEDNSDPTTCHTNLNIYRSYLEGYWSKMKNTLNKKEVELLPYAPLILTIECGMRFLEDFLRGDVYFHVAYPNHNLVRARTQIHQALDILENIDKLKEITKEITNQ